MKRQEIAMFVYSVCSSLRRSQAKTLSVLVPAAMTVARVSLAQLGRALAGQCQGAAKHGIKRVDRFVGNDRIEPTEAMRRVVQWFAEPRRKLLISLDWWISDGFSAWCWPLDSGEGPCLCCGPCIAMRMSIGRRITSNTACCVCFAPWSRSVLADRGFGRTEMARLCQRLNLHYIIRIAPSGWIHSARFTGRLSDYPIHRGQRHLLRNVAYRKAKPVVQQVAVLWLPDQEEPWYLMTDQTHLKAQMLAKVYG